jgi:hypothetical protein
VITTRAGAALALLLSIAAVAFAIVAFMSTVRDNGDTTGRLVQTRLTNDSDGAPTLFPVDDFFIGRGSDSRMHAFYVYPPGFYGHTRGCKVIWDPAAAVDTPLRKAGPGLYVEPCGGAKFDRDGALVDGPADRGLDYFATQPAVDGIIVDTKRLICGAEFVVADTPSPDETPEPSPSPKPQTCERVSPNTKKP